MVYLFRFCFDSRTPTVNVDTIKSKQTTWKENTSHDDKGSSLPVQIAHVAKSAASSQGGRSVLAQQKLRQLSPSSRFVNLRTWTARTTIHVNSTHNTRMNAKFVPTSQHQAQLASFLPRFPPHRAATDNDIVVAKANRFRRNYCQFHPVGKVPRCLLCHSKYFSPLSLLIIVWIINHQ